MRTVRNGRRALKVRRLAALVRKERELAGAVLARQAARLQQEIATLEKWTQR